MIVEHLGKSPRIHPSAYVAPNAMVCGDVTIGQDARVLFGAQVIAEGGSIEIGEKCIVMENAVLRSTARFSLSLGPHCLVGPQAHLVGCTIEESAFIATGVSIFHGAFIGARSQVRINGVVHILTHLPPNALVPIGWVAVGDPAEISPPNEHDRIWAVQQPLNFPKTVYGVERSLEGESNMPEITDRLSRIYGVHKEDRVI